QVKVEGFNFDSRKHLVEYDDVLNRQREIIYKLRRKILEDTATTESSLKEEVLKRVRNAISSLVNMSFVKISDGRESVNEDILAEFATIIPFDDPSKQQLIKQLEQLNSAEEKIDF